jgi:hypothetical protein
MKIGLPELKPYLDSTKRYASEFDLELLESYLLFPDMVKANGLSQEPGGSERPKLGGIVNEITALCLILWPTRVPSLSPRTV